jgi:hypothetical protein
MRFVPEAIVELSRGALVGHKETVDGCVKIVDNEKVLGRCRRYTQINRIRSR